MSDQQAAVVSANDELKVFTSTSRFAAFVVGGGAFSFLVSSMSTAQLLPELGPSRPNYRMRIFGQRAAARAAILIPHVGLGVISGGGVALSDFAGRSLFTEKTMVAESQRGAATGLIASSIVLAATKLPVHRKVVVGALTTVGLATLPWIAFFTLPKEKRPKVM
eukprot:comp16887_c0_seq1/m.27603 comp16887_c0_seq1/g.27603  ORF comp16887_c0_seq1/g.27603 comp16887_c0_seq1/m.27603 type:complete len:164 (+) comp16887_c0_seq1:3-494(+)